LGSGQRGHNEIYYNSRFPDRGLDYLLWVGLPMTEIQKPAKKPKGSQKLDKILEKLERLEQIEQAREIEGSLSLNEGEVESQMFQVGREHRDVSGEFDGLLTKTRYDPSWQNTLRWMQHVCSSGRLPEQFRRY
jgi:hypothetical protein